MYRELQEEVGLRSDQVAIMGATRSWLCYRLPERYIRRQRELLCIGQKQIWFLLRPECGEETPSVWVTAKSRNSRNGGGLNTGNLCVM